MDSEHTARALINKEGQEQEDDEEGTEEQGHDLDKEVAKHKRKIADTLAA